MGCRATPPNPGQGGDDEWANAKPQTEDPHDPTPRNKKPRPCSAPSFSSNSFPQGGGSNRALPHDARLPRCTSSNSLWQVELHLLMHTCLVVHVLLALEGCPRNSVLMFDKVPSVIF